MRGMGDGERGRGFRYRVWLGVVCGLLAAAPAARATMLRPLEGSGNFLSTVDVLNRHEADGSTTVILLISVANRDVTFEAAETGLRGRLGVTAALTGADGVTVRRATSVDLKCGDLDEASAASMYQVLPIVLAGVRAASGTLSVRLDDMLKERPGLLSRIKSGNWVRSEVEGDWSAGAAEPVPEGLALGDPVFLAKAPIGLWSQHALDAAAPESSLLTEYLHPNRRYGLEQSHLQVYFEMDPPLQGDRAGAGRSGIRVEVLGKDLQFALRDTIRLGEAQLTRLAGGGSTGIFYDLDLKNLPPGAFSLSCAPANAKGRGWVAEFDVVWSLNSLNRYADELEGEGRVILYGDDLKRFEAAGQAEREAILEKFWQGHDPDPASAVNENYQEFLRRASYVRQNLGGFTRAGAKDPRGQVYLLLGPPDEVQTQVLPINEKDQEDAMVRVFDNYAPEREGTQAKGSGGIPLPTTRQSRRAVAVARAGVTNEKGFELWIYTHAGRQLFPNPYSSKMLGLRFLFVDRSGTGNWVLNSTNASEFGVGD